MSQKIRIGFIVKSVTLGALLIGGILVGTVALMTNEWALYKMGFATYEQIAFVIVESGADVTLDEVRSAIEKTEWKDSATGVRSRTFCVRETAFTIKDMDDSYEISVTGGACA